MLHNHTTIRHCINYVVDKGSLNNDLRLGSAPHLPAVQRKTTDPWDKVTCSNSGFEQSTLRMRVKQAPSLVSQSMKGPKEDSKILFRKVQYKSKKA
jgi:hypothetical protein